MRAVHLSDLHHAACALRSLPDEARAGRMQTALIHAKAADLYRKRTRKSHAQFGHGTLSSAFGPVDVPPRCDTAYLRALRVVVTELLHDND